MSQNRTTKGSKAAKTESAAAKTLPADYEKFMKQCQDEARGKTDRGLLPNLKWRFADSYNHVLCGGTLRIATVRELPISKEISGAITTLEAGSIREPHWHNENEWAYMISGSARVTVVDQDLKTFQGDVGPGEGWFFPTGIPHSIQALEGGCEFLLVFDTGDFNEENTFNLTDWLARTPKDILCKNVGAAPGSFDSIPTAARGVFKSALPGPLSQDKVKGLGPAPLAFTYKMSKARKEQTEYGIASIVDCTNFPITTMAAAMLEIKPGGMRELHWHPNANEWQYYVEGKGRMTVFAAPGKAQTIDFQAGDVGFVPKNLPHYIENTGTGILRVVETFDSPQFMSVPLAQWLKYTPHALVTATIGIGEDILAAIPKDKTPIVGRKK